VKIEVLVLPSKDLYEVEFPAGLPVRQLTRAICNHLQLENYWELRSQTGRNIVRENLDHLVDIRGPQRFFLVSINAWP
jgi:hypothetical protein